MQDDSDELQILRHRIEELERDKQDLQMQVRFKKKWFIPDVCLVFTYHIHRLISRL